MDANPIKCVAVGDTDSDKTSLIWTYVTGTYPTEYVPKVMDNYSVDAKINGETYSLGLFDTAGQEDYDRLRPITYSQTDVFLVCFSVVSPTGFENVKLKWIPEIKHHCPDTPYLLVGTKIDLRDDKDAVRQLAQTNKKPITQAEGETLAEEIQAEKYMECSAAAGEGVKEKIHEAIILALNNYQSEKTENLCVMI